MLFSVKSFIYLHSVLRTSDFSDIFYLIRGRMPEKGQVNSQERKEIPLDSTSGMRKNSFENNILERLHQIRDMIQVMATSVSNLSDYFIKETRGP